MGKVLLLFLMEEKLKGNGKMVSMFANNYKKTVYTYSVTVE